MELHQIADRIAISDFLTAYSRAVDTKDWALFRSLFTEDAEIDYTSSGGIAGGVEEVATWMESTMAMFSTTQHIIANETVAIDGDTASVQAVLFNPMVFEARHALLHLWCGYDHDLVRRGRLEKPPGRHDDDLDHDGRLRVLDEHTWATIPELIDDAAKRFGDREAIADGDLSWNFAEFRTEIRRAAGALQASGIEAGDRLASGHRTVGSGRRCARCACCGRHCRAD